MDRVYVEGRAKELLKKFYGNDATFRENQLESIVSTVSGGKTLLVQKTGWGKSIVYFISAKILKENGKGPALIISPLIALMKNQVEAAEKIGIKAATINSENSNMWNDIFNDISEYDAIIVGPERLSNENFMMQLENIKNISLFVVDEAHSISDWGNDFRPDYQRIVKLLNYFPDNISVLGTTATANDRVINDIKRQLGDDLKVVRGNLMRNNLAIQVNPIQSKEERLAFLASVLSSDERIFKEQGIIYCLTTKECDKVSLFLQENDISAKSYHSKLDKETAQQVLEEFENGTLKVLVSTIKLGMGYDKSSIRFVIHMQLPKDIISYYQQIGRAGRDGKLSYVILLHGYEDEEILDYFISAAQCKPELLEIIVNECKEGLKIKELLSKININQSKLEEAIKYLMVHEYLYKEDSYYRTNLSKNLNCEDVRRKQKNINDVRIQELEQLKEYLDIDYCYMKFIASSLDAPDVKDNCCICANCNGRQIFSTEINKVYLDKAKKFLEKKSDIIEPRKQWGNGTTIKKDQRMETGWVLCDDYYSKIGQEVKKSKYVDNVISDLLIDDSYEFLKNKVVDNQVDLIVPVPSLRRKDLVSDFAKKLGYKLGVDTNEVVNKIEEGQEQKRLLNSPQQEYNIRSTLKIENIDINDKIILLVDDMVDSRWTFTVIASELLKKGAKKVIPFALVRTGRGE